ncbi:hypothetical protein A2U94_07650 [Bacillus sp. VT 712]|uniref:Uncharacterized protein n=1 Tax=Priestia veravalensis TaxID=1414648 RepID=A0A0V8JPR4_9BACI|nr:MULTISPECIES: hypothetical protein [Bacillaceae]KSU88924.1 hypothetical protein AS180_05350 [Priestia veravalensis]KZB92157.1 hypothetical protein A2U94_07650 [Bacillus sp. VT 712]SCC03155.1 hypothetical protein GA0061087_100860 [Priestia flexa]
MKTVKFIIFLVGIALVNYVGGIPTDARNLFISHTIFLAPLLVDFYGLLKVQSLLKWFIILIWLAGILTIVSNILGVAGVLTLVEKKVVFNSQYYMPFDLSVHVHSYLLIVSCVYTFIFMGTITFDNIFALNKKIMKKQKKKTGREEMVTNVHPR